MAEANRRERSDLIWICKNQASRGAQGETDQDGNCRLAGVLAATVGGGKEKARAGIVG